MTPNSLARTVFVLLGVYLITTSLETVANALTERAVLWSAANTHGSGLVLVGISIASAVVIQVGPGVLLIWKGPSWADRLVPPSAPASEIAFLSLLAVGLMLLGVKFLLSGVVGLVGSSVLLALPSEVPEGRIWEGFTSAVIFILGAAVLIRVGSRMARSAA